MATLDWQLRETGETTLVELFVTSDVDTRVEISSNIDPVWPPRRHNRLAAGWDESGFEGVVTAGEPLVLGYASPADPVDPPASIVGTKPVSRTPEESPTPEELVRALGEAGPPRDAVPTPEDTRQESTAVDRRSPGTDDTPSSEPDRSDGRAPTATGPGSRGRSQRSGAGQPRGAPGETVDDWLDAVSRRIETAERLAAVETAEEARAAVEAAGGIGAVKTLCEQLETDRDRIGRIETRRAALDRRLAGVEVPLSALERLA